MLTKLQKVRKLSKRQLVGADARKLKPVSKALIPRIGIGKEFAQ